MSEDETELELHHHSKVSTTRAYRVSLDGDEETGAWLPKSEVSMGRRTGRTDPVYIFTVPTWLVRDRGLGR